MSVAAVGAESERADGAGGVGAPVACGALGSYDAERVARIAAAFGDGMRRVHDDGRSILYCDRDPIRWSGEREHGYAWIEGDVWRRDPSNWEEASRLGACGLALGARRRLVHSSVSGYARLYWIEDRGATYFASQVDPLVSAWPRPLSIDWDAWAATIILRHPVGGRTPLRRSGASARMRRSAVGSGARVSSGRHGRGRRSSHSSASMPGPTPGSQPCARCWGRWRASSYARSAAAATRGSCSARFPPTGR